MRHYLLLALLLPLLAAGLSIAADPSEPSPANTVRPENTQNKIQQAAFATQPKKLDPSANATPSELTIRKALKKSVTLNAEKKPLADVLRTLSRDFGINVFLDTRGLNEVGLTPESPITIEVEGIQLKSVLNLMLMPLDLAYTVKDEVLVITSDTRAQGKQTTRTYPVADLVVPIPMAGPVPAGEKLPILSASAVNFESLIEIIESSAQPRSWERIGGTSSIRSYDPTLSLVIRQSSEGHQAVEELLTQLRRQQDFQVDVETRFLENIPEDFWEQIGLDLDLDKKKTTRQQPQNNGPLGGIILTDKEVALLLNEAQNNARTNLIQAPRVTLFNAQTAGLTDYLAGGKQHPLKHSLYLQPVISADRRDVRLNLRVSDREATGAVTWSYVNTVPDGQTILIELARQQPHQTGVPAAEQESKVFKNKSADQTRSVLLIRPKILVAEEEEAPFPDAQK
ncbi:hypothetical protein Enr10x_02370 [Gimesia panareensis]|uniref:Secretin/TonB short N-terminal domain-containing protein n=1 Tax=Gimesia panareensis TaxID=2527978 RepID=A0A517PZZ0_9PLAN|nr:hypothetical protein [Gimesia panareensis]QDT24943.1 hypothetical protein Enr10x_02370 [Gimesia panareensis]